MESWSSELEAAEWRLSGVDSFTFIFESLSGGSSDKPSKKL